MFNIKKIRVIFCFGIILFFTGESAAQNVKTIEDFEQVWLGYFNQSRFTKRLGMWVDVHLRTKDDLTNKLSQSIARLGVTYYLDDVTKLTAGYAYVNHFPQDNHAKVSQPEHRIWQQLQWHTRYGKKRMMQWFRLEEKFRRKILNDSTLAPGSGFNYKLRYNIWYDIPLDKRGIVPGSFSLVVNDEVHINFGKQVINNYFDQNRFFAGVKYQLNANDNIQAGYMNVFQQLAAGNRYKNIHAVRIFYFHNIDLRSKS